MTTFIKDLINLPERVQRGDFVLRLTEGVTKPEGTVDSYVVTEQLEKCFDRALGLIKSAIETRSSKATYLDGSFGSGKSHFMAVLHLILQGNTRARAIAELAAVVTRHNTWTQGKKFLVVPFHMIDAPSLEARVLGGYVEHIAKLHPGAPVPPMYVAEKLFTDARNLRANIGDEAFFRGLNDRGTPQDDEWGALEEGWNAASFERALTGAPPVNGRPGDPERGRLVGALVERYFQSAANITTAEFVDLDEGLAVISKHAKALGYDAVILFLDELILWLASRAADTAFISREGPKVSKLVESQRADRPIPIVSFIARQRDLREIVGKDMPGAQKLAFSDSLKFWEARFDRIKLDDRNLPEIVSKRLLRAKSPAAAQILAAEFEKTSTFRQEVMDTLLTRESDREMFRKVYPFSPALVETLVAVSSLLQRERTALKIMVQLLDQQRDTLKLGEIVPVGDLFDAIAEGDEAFSDVTKAHFENARRLYESRLRPLLESEHNLRFDDLASRPADDVAARKLRNDDRLIKTLLLAALAPEVESLKNLTAPRLAALNHGTIKTPIPGQEGPQVRKKCLGWAAQVGQIRIGEDATNPTITVQLTGIDTEAIIEQAQSEDNRGNRIRKFKELLLGALEVKDSNDFWSMHPFSWRGTRRNCEVLVANVRELSDASLENDTENWKFIIDYPFDEPPHTPRSDVNRLQIFEQGHTKGARTIVWLPSFLNAKVQEDLGTLIKLDHILTGERYDQFVSHLSPIDRAQIRSILENQRSPLRSRLLLHLESAFGVGPADPQALDSGKTLDLKDHFQTLDSGFELRPPAEATLRGTFLRLLQSGLEHQFPAHPNFDEDAPMSRGGLRAVLGELEKVMQTPERRLLIVDKGFRRTLKQIVNPLQVGVMGEDHLAPSAFWDEHFDRKLAESGGNQMTVRRLREWMNDPKPRGLPVDLQNLVILTFAAQTNRTFYQHGNTVEASLENLNDEMELREQILPSTADWESAVKRADAVFGVKASPLVSAGNVAKLAEEARRVAKDGLDACVKLEGKLKELEAVFPPGAAEESPRVKTAVATRALAAEVAKREPEKIVEILARPKQLTSESAMGTSFRSAKTLFEAIQRTKWQILEAVRNFPSEDERHRAAGLLWKQLGEAFYTEEYALGFVPELESAEQKATNLLAPSKPAPPTIDRGNSTPTAAKIVKTGEGKDLRIEGFSLATDEIKKLLETHPGATLDLKWKVVLPSASEGL